RGAGTGGFRGGGFEDILKDVFGGARARAGRGGTGAQFDPEDFGMPGRGPDVSAALTITLPEAVNGASKRIHLPNGKDVDVKIPAGLTEGQQIRLKGQGMPGPDGSNGDLLITV